MRYRCTTYTPADGTTTTDYAEDTAALLLRRALENGFTLTADPAATTVTLTRGMRTVTLTPAEPLGPLTPAQRRALLALAADPGQPITWERSARNVSHLEHAGHALSHAVSVTLSDRGMVTGTGHPGTRATLTLRAWLAIARNQGNPSAAAAILRDAYRQPAPTRT
ncbi:hypothetical protein [Streptomyces griseoaurantiacus]|uniref:hypothetical protein n=1 Tax=Streptomyces griseoaurantiacus TaxID=68213 RepID=UPI0036CC3A7D